MFDAATVGGPALLWYGTGLETRKLEIVRVRVSPPRLPQAFDGVTIAQLSDLHLGPWVDPLSVRAAVDAVLSLKPDTVVLTGDYVSELQSGEADLIVQELSRLSAPLGVYAVLGNHDHWTDSQTVAAAIRRAGLGLLCNANTAIERNGVNVYVAGIDDVWEEKADLDTALKGTPRNACVILLAHEPDYADAASADPRLSLQLSGHSHGGQVRWPGGTPIYVSRLGRRYPQGLRQVKDMLLYTNRGIGVVFPPIRFNCRPEVTLFELAAVGEA